MANNITLSYRFVQLQKNLEEDAWLLDRINGSHHVFIKAGRRCIPVAFHGGTTSLHHVSMMLKQIRESYHKEELVMNTNFVAGEMTLTKREATEADRKSLSNDITTAGSATVAAVVSNANPFTVNTAITKHELDDKENTKL